jgi:uncharacterized membrane protein YqaE (UPF0057 family)
MKFSTNLKSFAIIAILTVFLASCSGERYGSIQRGSVKSKAIAKVEKANPSITNQTEEQSAVTPESVEKTEAPEVITSFNAANAIKIMNSRIVKNAFVKNAIRNAVRANVPEVKYSSPYEFKKGTGINKKHEVDYILLIILAILIPPVAVGLASDWDDTTAIIINLILCILCWLPGVIHALIYGYCSPLKTITGLLLMAN